MSSNIKKNKKKVNGGKKTKKTKQSNVVMDKGFKRRPKTKVPTRQLVAISASNDSKVGIAIKCSADSNSLRIAAAGFASYLYSRGLQNNDPTVSVNAGGASYDLINGALSYMLQGIYSEMGSGTVELADRPLVVHNLIAALRPKSVPFHSNCKVSYSWNSIPNAYLFNDFTFCDGKYWVVCPGADLGTYNDNALTGPGAGDVGDWSRLMKCLPAVTNDPGLRIVGYKEKSELENDVSTFARVYVYNGVQASSTSGFYKDIELEVPIRCPSLAQICTYGQDDRAPRKLQIGSGDPSQLLTLPLMPAFSGYFNKIPTIFKQVDYEEIYTMLVLWMCRLKQLASEQQGSSPDLYTSLPFSQQDFRVALRQALLSVFDTQCFSQFQGTVNYNGTDNAFVPFLVHGGCYGSAAFAELRVPELLAENLGALRARSLRIANKSAVNRPYYVPVLGRYFQDIPVTPQFVTGSGDVVPLFTTVAQSPIRMTDCYMNDGVSVNGPINVNNSYYQGVMRDWNKAVADLSFLSCTVTPIRRDHGPLGLGLIYSTRIESVPITEDKPKIAAPARREIQNLKYAKNIGYKIDAKGNVTGLPPATDLKIADLLITSIRPLATEEESLYKALILPVLRAQNNPLSDVIGVPMYQIEVSEVASHLMNGNLGQIADGTGMFSKMAEYAQMCAPGLARDESNDYTRLMKVLTDKGQGGMLSELLGGVVKSFAPGLSGVVDTVASILPF